VKNNNAKIFVVAAAPNNNLLQHQAAWGKHSSAPCSSFLTHSKTPSLDSPRKFQFTLNLFLRHSPSSNWRQLNFRLALAGWPISKIFGNLSFFIRRKCPSDLKTVLRQFLWKISCNFSFVFWTAHASQPYLTTVIALASNILILVRRHAS